MKRFALFVSFMGIAFVVAAQDPEPYEPIKVFGIELSVLLSIVFGSAAALLGGLWGNIKTKLAQVAGLLVYLSQAVEDNRVSQEEEKEIVRRIRELIGAKFLASFKAVKP